MLTIKNDYCAMLEMPKFDVSGLVQQDQFALACHGEKSRVASQSERECASSQAVQLP